MTAENRAQSQFLRIFSGATTYYRWQNYYIGQTITYSSADWAYHPFECNGLVFGTTGGDSSLAISVPSTGLANTVFQTALENNYLCEVTFYQFYTELTQVAPQASQITVGTFVGEVVGIGGSFAELTVNLGSSLSPVGAQVPPRKYSGALVGAPIRL